jgi:type II secretory pathway pseudopilin PulG
MGIEIIVAIVMCVVTLLGLLRGLGKWVAGVERNTEATDRLAQAFDAFAEKTGNTLADHEHRLTVVETRLDV